VRGLRKMVDADSYCPDVVVQVASVTRALQEVAVGLLTDHLHHCVVDEVRVPEADGQASLGEVASTIRQVIRL
jgi:DNA-binding FrmR family transcriptional regulator